MAEKKTEIQVFDGGVTEEQVHGTTQHCVDRSSRQSKKRITSHLLRGDVPEGKEDKDGFIKACALVRSFAQICTSTRRQGAATTSRGGTQRLCGWKK